MRYQRKTNYQNAEEYTLEKFDAKPTNNSGAFTQKGDCLLKVGGVTIRLDTKSTYTNSYSIKKDAFDNMESSLHSDSINGMHFVFYYKEGNRFHVKKDHILMKASDFIKLLEIIKNNG